jgi:hypothetical protein
MPGGKRVRYIVELDDRFAAFTGSKRFWQFVAVAMREIEHAIADARGGSIGE